MTEHFNKLTPAEAERLAMLSEECGEVVKIIGKIFRHGYDSSNPLIPREHGVFIPTNYKMLIDELNDIGAVVYGMIQAKDFSEDQFDQENQREVWLKKLKWTHHQS